MISPEETTRLSRFLSLVLRHRPETIGISLDEGGWTNVAILLQKMRQAGFAIDWNMLEQIVATNNKKRFAFDEHKTNIRANQGHSVNVALGYQPQTPPGVLYHGTATRFLQAILAGGLHRGRRHHVHLSASAATAKAVGQRHGQPVVLQVAAGRMHEQGHLFYRSANGVWLTDAVPPQYLQLTEA